MTSEGLTQPEVIDLLRAGNELTSSAETWGKRMEYELAREGNRLVVRWYEYADPERKTTKGRGVIWSGTDLELAAKTFLEHASTAVDVRPRNESGQVFTVLVPKVTPFPLLSLKPIVTGDATPVLNGKNGAHK